MSEVELYGVAVFCITGDIIGSAEVYKRRGGWFTVEATPFLYAERNKYRKGFRDEYRARKYARDLAFTFLGQALMSDPSETEDDYIIQYSEYGVIDNGPQY